MPESMPPSVRVQLRKANALISDRRYDEARDLLQQIDHSQAKLWLKQINTQKKQAATPAISPVLLLAGIGGAVVIVGVVVVLLFARPFLALAPAGGGPVPLEPGDPNFISDEEIYYATLADYCYQITGYGGSDLCLDWTEVLLREHRTITIPCVEPYLDTASLAEADYVAIDLCLDDAAIPPPF